MSTQISGAILAGGQSSRMGQNKALVEVGGIPIIDRVIARILPIVDELVIITNQPAEYVHLGFSIHPDSIPGKAALGGVYTAIERTQSPHTLITSCDQPFLNTKLLQFIASLRDGYDVVIPVNREQYPQSMHALYGENCLQPIRDRLETDQLKVIGFFSDVRVREVTNEEIDQFDPHRYSFINVNTPEDLIKANQLASKLDKSNTIFR